MGVRVRRARGRAALRRTSSTSTVPEPSVSISAKHSSERWRRGAGACQREARGATTAGGEGGRLCVFRVEAAWDVRGGGDVVSAGAVPFISPRWAGVSSGRRLLPRLRIHDAMSAARIFKRRSALDSLLPRPLLRRLPPPPPFSGRCTFVPALMPPRRLPAPGAGRRIACPSRSGRFGTRARSRPGLCLCCARVARERARRALRLPLLLSTGGGTPTGGRPPARRPPARPPACPRPVAQSARARARAPSPLAPHERSRGLDLAKYKPYP